jgi:hypothetical protein
MMTEQVKRFQAYNRELVGSTVKTMAAVQDHAQSVIRIGLENAPYMPEAGKAMARQWAAGVKERSNFYGRVMLDTCDRYGALLDAFDR